MYQSMEKNQKKTFELSRPVDLCMVVSIVICVIFNALSTIVAAPHLDSNVCYSESIEMNLPNWLFTQGLSIDIIIAFGVAFLWCICKNPSGLFGVGGPSLCLLCLACLGIIWIMIWDAFGIGIISTMSGEIAQLCIIDYATLYYYSIATVVSSGLGFVLLMSIFVRYRTHNNQE